MTKRPKLDRRFTIAWALIALQAVVVELVAIALRRRGDTASEHVWWINRLHPAVYVVVSIILVWAAAHLISFGAIDRWLTDVCCG